MCLYRSRLVIPLVIDVAHNQGFFLIKHFLRSLYYLRGEHVRGVWVAACRRGLQTLILFNKLFLYFTILFKTRYILRDPDSFLVLNRVTVSNRVTFCFGWHLTCRLCIDNV